MPFSLYYGRNGTINDSQASKSTQSSCSSSLMDSSIQSSQKFYSESQSTIKEKIEDTPTPQCEIFQEANRKMSSSVEQFSQQQVVEEQKIMELQLQKRAFSVQVSIDKIIDIDFMETNIIQNRYTKYLKDQPNNVQAKMTLGYLNIYAFSNYDLSTKYFEEVLQIDHNEIDAYLGICICIIQNRELKSISKAKSFLNKCLEIKRQYWRVYYVYAWLLLMANKEKEALNYLNKGLVIDSQQVELLSLQLLLFRYCNIDNLQENAKKVANLNKRHNPVVYQRIGSVYSSELKDYTKAIYFYKQAYEINKEDLMIHIHLADNYFKNNDQNEAESYLINVQNPKNSILLNYLGQIEVNKENKLELFQKSAAADSYNKWANYNLAQYKLNQGEFENAIKYYKKVLEQDPEDEQAHAGIGYILGFHLQDYQQAIEHYEIALNVNFQKFEYLIKLSELNFNLNCIDTSQKYLNQCLQINSNHPKIYEFLGKIENLKGNTSKAIEFIEKQISLDPKNADAYLRLISKPEEAKKNYLKSLELDQKIKLANYQLGLLDQDFKQQIKYYQAELSINPQNIEAINSVAISLQNQGKYDLAESFIQKGLKRDPNNYILYKTLGVLNKIQKKYNESIKNYQLALTLYKQNNVELQVLLANSYYLSGQIDQAIKTYQLAIQQDPSYYQSYLELGNIYEELKNYEEAVKQFEIYLQYQPLSSDALFKIGNIEYLHLKNIEKAYNCFSNSIKLNPLTNSSCYRQLGLIQNEKGEYQQAQQFLLQAIEINKNEEDLYLPIALISYNSFKNKWQAIEYLEKYMQLFPNSEKEEQMLNEWYLSVNNAGRAREYYEKQIQENPQNITAYMKVATLEFRIKQYYKAIFQYNKILELDPNHKLSLYNIGICYKQLQKYEEAIEQFQNVIKQYQSFSLAYYQIGEIYQQHLKNSKKAVKFLRQAIEFKSQDADYYFCLGNAFNDLDFKYEALGCFQKIIDFNPKYPKIDFCRKYISDNIAVKIKKYKETSLKENDCNIF